MTKTSKLFYAGFSAALIAIDIGIALVSPNVGIKAIAVGAAAFILMLSLDALLKEN